MSKGVTRNVDRYALAYARASAHSPMPSDFIESIKTHQAAFGLSLNDEQIERLDAYYNLIQQNNEFLHLVAPMSAEEFAVRHILESLTLLECLPENVKFADIGAGGGLPSIPCLLLRHDLKAVLIDSKVKKVRFLESAMETLGLKERATIINRQFEETDLGNCEFVTCRALDKFTEKLPRLLKWSQGRGLLLFGGNNLREALCATGRSFGERLMPLSDQRMLFVVRH